MNEDWPVKNLAQATVDSMAKWSRKAADLYPTPEDATQALLIADPPAKELIVKEPACGEGKMAFVLRANGYAVEASDIRETGYGEGGQDFTKYRGDPEKRKLAMITNPPFFIAEQFVRRTIFFEYAALLLKSNFWNTSGRLKLFEQFTPAAIYPVSWRIAFLKEERGDSPLMDCNWYVWKRGVKLDGFAPLPRPKTFPIYERPLSVCLQEAADERRRLSEVLHG